MGIFITIMICAFTKTTANFVYDLGLDRWASQLYYNVYEKRGDLACGYKSLNISIQLRDNSNIVTKYEKLIADEDFGQLIDNIVKSNENLNIGVLEKSALIVEEDYLRDNYILALKNIGRVDDSFRLALEDFRENYTLTNRDLGLYSLNFFLEGNGFNRFDDVYDGFDSVLIVEMQEYFDNIVNLFIENKDVNQSIDRAYLVALADRIMIVGQDINAIYAHNDSNEDRVDDNIVKMTEVNNIVKGII